MSSQNDNADTGLQAATLFVSLATMVLTFALHLRFHLKSKCCGSLMAIDLGKSKSEETFTSSSSDEEKRKNIPDEMVEICLTEPVEMDIEKGINSEREHDRDYDLKSSI
jgi:hypothetical protein